MKRIHLLILVLLFATITPAVAQKETPARLFKYTINDNVVTITGRKDRKGEIHDVIVPAFIKGKPVKKIGDRAFLAMHIHSIILPAGISEIGKEAFRGCRSLKEFVIQCRLLKRSPLSGSRPLTGLWLPTGGR